MTTKTKKEKEEFYSKKPNNFQNKYYCPYCKHLLNYVYHKDNDAFFTIGHNKVLVCNKCSKFFRKGTYFKEIVKVEHSGKVYIYVPIFEYD